MIEYIDTHSHLNLEQFSLDQDSIIDSMRRNSVRTQTVGVDVASSRAALDLSRQYPEISRAVVGIHPAYITEENVNSLMDSLSEIESMAHDPSCVGIGECGYDFFRGIISDGLLRMQDEIFQSQIDIAVRNNIAVMLHLRSKKGSYEAYDRAINALAAYGDARPRAQAHFYAGTIDQARRLLDLGCYLSFTGVVTFARDYDEIIRFVPEDRILCETDSPYVSPVPHRGERCNPIYVQYVYHKIVEIRGADPARFQNQTAQNVRELWKW